MRLLSIDPGNVESGWVVLDTDTMKPLVFAKSGNGALLTDITSGTIECDDAVIEMVASYGMSVGATVFETCVWIGRFQQALLDSRGIATERIVRLDVKMHHCHSSSATDSNIRQALVDRFAPNEQNHGKGTKAQPGFFYGFAADVWQAYALGVHKADKINGNTWR